MSRGAAEGVSRTAALLSFLRPGILHELGNALFTIRGHAEVGSSSEVAHQGVLRACQRAESALAILRDLGAATGAQDPVGLDELVRRLVSVARVPLRERGVRLDQQPVTGAASNPVDGATAVLAMTAALVALVERLPVGFDGELRFEVAADHGRPVVSLVLAAAAGCLPFPLDLRAAAGDVCAVVRDGCVQVECEPGLRLRFDA